MLIPSEFAFNPYSEQTILAADVPLCQLMATSQNTNRLTGFIHRGIYVRVYLRHFLFENYSSHLKKASCAFWNNVDRRLTRTSAGIITERWPTRWTVIWAITPVRRALPGHHTHRWSVCPSAYVGYIRQNKNCQPSINRGQRRYQSVMNNASESIQCRGYRCH